MNFMSKKNFGLLGVLALGIAVGTAACGDTKEDPDFVPGDDFIDTGFVSERFSCADFEGKTCVEIPGGDAAALLAHVNEHTENDQIIILGKGTYKFDSELTLPGNAKGLALLGQGRGRTVLDFADSSNGNGVHGQGTDNIWLQGFTVIDTAIDGIKIEDADGVVMRDVEATWTNKGDKNNGPYGIYPVRVANVLIEHSVAQNASDAGLYVGQCENAIVRNNQVWGNVAGLEIENTQYAEVYNNHAEDNTGGIVVFDLPGNPIFGHDIRVYDNTIVRNNRANFASSGIVGEIPSGTGTFAMASRRVHIYNNVYEDNNTVDIALLDGIVGDQDNTRPENWRIELDRMRGDYKGYGFDVCYDEVDEDDEAIVVCKLDPDANEDEADYLSNWRTHQILIANNTHKGGGSKAGKGTFGDIIGALFASEAHLPTIIYDATSESGFNQEDPSTLSNDNDICITGLPEGATVAIGRIADLQRGPILTNDNLYVYGCDNLKDGPIADVQLDGVDH